jgi:hypothetical protein
MPPPRVGEIPGIPTATRPHVAVLASRLKPVDRRISNAADTNTGSQSGIITNDRHLDARLIERGRSVQDAEHASMAPNRPKRSPVWQPSQERAQ